MTSKPRTCIHSRVLPSLCCVSGSVRVAQFLCMLWDEGFTLGIRPCTIWEGAGNLKIQKRNGNIRAVTTNSARETKPAQLLKRNYKGEILQEVQEKLYLSVNMLHGSVAKNLAKSWGPPWINSWDVEWKQAKTSWMCIQGLHPESSTVTAASRLLSKLQCKFSFGPSLTWL